MEQQGTTCTFPAAWALPGSTRLAQSRSGREASKKFSSSPSKGVCGNHTRPAPPEEIQLLLLTTEWTEQIIRREKNSLPPLIVK